MVSLLRYLFFIIPERASQLLFQSHSPYHRVLQTPFSCQNGCLCCVSTAGRKTPRQPYEFYCGYLPTDLDGLFNDTSICKKSTGVCAAQVIIYVMRVVRLCTGCRWSVRQGKHPPSSLRYVHVIVLEARVAIARCYVGMQGYLGRDGRCARARGEMCILSLPPSKVVLTKQTVYDTFPLRHLTLCVGGSFLVTVAAPRSLFLLGPASAYRSYLHKVTGLGVS